jgi:peptide deformylase
MLKRIVLFPDALLLRRSFPVSDELLSRTAPQSKRRLAEIIENMKDTMLDARGMGLAAVQIGILKRIVVVDMASLPIASRPVDAPILVFINPSILLVSKEKVTAEEGCLSLPGCCVQVTRPASMWMNYRNIDGVLNNIKADGTLARCLQHEIDHLDGRLIIHAGEAVWRNERKLDQKPKREKSNKSLAPES